MKKERKPINLAIRVGIWGSWFLASLVFLYAILFDIAPKVFTMKSDIMMYIGILMYIGAPTLVAMLGVFLWKKVPLEIKESFEE